MDTFTHTLSVSIANRLNQYVPREGLEYEKVVLGAEILLINIPKLLIIFSISAFMGILFETVLVLIGFNCLRRTAFGLHASNNITCTITSTCLFVIVPFFLQNYTINNYAIFAIFTGILTSIYLYAPADTEARPILGAKRRAALKKKTIITGLILFALVLIIPRNDVKLFLTLGAVYEGILLLPGMYMLLKRTRNNYEAFPEYE